MKIFLQKNHRLVFYSCWFILALTQSASTELIADEAYYWVFSRFLSWGYFDHPPMIALLIKWGYAVFQNELGVRLLCVLMNALTIFFIETLTDRKNPFLFYTIVLSIAVFQIIGFMAVPDTPLLFFAVVFFLCYKNFVKKMSWQNTVLLGLVTALLFYSKYHGVLIVIFTILSNIKLLRHKQIWLVGLVALILFSPHLLWQWENNWVSLRYHLFESNVSSYRFSYTTDYLLGQLLLAGPLAGFILLPAAFLYKPQIESDSYRIEKALKFNLTGIYIFFLFSSFRGKVEPNWTMQALIPLIILSYQFLATRPSWIKKLRIVSVVSLALIMVGRIYLVSDIGPDNEVKNRFHHNREWATAVADKTGYLPVVFYNSYQRASLFWFYSGKPSHSHNALRERRNNYNFWPTEDSLLGRPVYFADVYEISSYDDSVQTKKGWIGIKKDSSYSPLGKIVIIPEKINFSGGNLKVTFTINIPRLYFSFLSSRPELKNELVAEIFKEKTVVKEFYTGIKAQQLPGKKVHSVVLPLPDLPVGKYYCLFGFKVKNYSPTHNSEKIMIAVK